MVIDAWSRYFVQLLSRLVCQLTISFHTLLRMTFHVVGSRRNTTKKYTDSPSMVIFQLLPRKFVTQTWFCDCQQYLCLFHIVFECSPSIHDPRKMLVLPNQLLCLSSFPHRINVLFFQPILCLPHTQIRIILFTMYKETLPIWNFFPTVLQQDFSNCLSHNTVVPKDDRTDFSQEERLGLPYWTMI